MSYKVFNSMKIRLKVKLKNVIFISCTTQNSKLVTLISSEIRNLQGKLLDCINLKIL